MSRLAKIEDWISRSKVTIASRSSRRRVDHTPFEQILTITMKYSILACALLASSAAAFAPATSQVGPGGEFYVIRDANGLVFVHLSLVGC